MPVICSYLHLDSWHFWKKKKKILRRLKVLQTTERRTVKEERCDYFRVDWKEYWYMVPKFNHHWNTLDLILVTVLPAVALVIIVVVIFYCVYYCNSEKAGNQTSPSYREAQHNLAFAAEMAGNLGHIYQQSPRGDWVGQIPKAVLRRQDFDDVPTPCQLENYSPKHPQPLRRPDPATDHFSNQRPQYEKFGYPSNNLPYAGYAEGRQYQKY
ncbi:uncharacterized protein LOC115333558 isoform X2 [Aquila chrysaetos chrysaetos]|uniref:uncharacterized protein LOC115333558 isoform X2 n=1 Tax=Aquila chrysaetos chrysaetos TaxID=223781 RepID=UPI001B7D37E6|nr:uncharacterized protein LOC115333558 isoform X2 [Aquila chrysaetos chrysaetos]